MEINTHLNIKLHFNIFFVLLPIFPIYQRLNTVDDNNVIIIESTILFDFCIKEKLNF